MILQRLDALDSLRLGKRGIYERFETEFVRATLKAGQTFIDVGAHIGYYTTLAASIVGPEGAVIAFEPEPGNFEILRENAAAVSAPVVLYPVALSDKDGMTQLYLSRKNSGDHRLFFSRKREAIEVPMMRLDALPDLQGRRIDFLKVDVQGLETRVLAGARETILRSPRLHGIIEISPSILELAGSSKDELLALMEELGLEYSKDRLALLEPGSHVNLTFARRPAR